MVGLLSSVVGLLLAHIQVDHGDHEYDGEEDQGGGGGAAFAVAQCVVDVADHGVEGLTAHGLHIVTEDTDDGGLLLEAADEAGDDHVSQHGGEQGHRDLGEHADTGGAVHLGGVVILLVDALETAQKDQDLEGQGVPDDVDHQHRDVGPVARAGVDPVDGIHTEQTQDVVDDTEGGVIGTKANDVEHSLEDHADGDGVGDVGEEEDGLEQSLQRLDGIQAHGDEQRQDGGDRHRQNGEEQGVLEAVLEALVVNDLDEVLDTELELQVAAQILHDAVIVPEGHPQGVEDGPYRKDEKQYDGGSEIQPRFPFMLAFYHITSPRNTRAPRSPC